MELILHHYDFSNYAEKARLALGYKGFSWRGVTIPPVAPKPDLTPLTGGYRRTPVLQIGADVFCDTRLILRELERRKPQPSLYPEGASAQADMIAYWAEHQFFRPMSLYVSGTNMDLLPENLQADRSAMRGLPLPDAATVQRAARRNAPFVRAQLPWIEALLSRGDAWITGVEITVADFAVYHPLWFMTARSQRLVRELAPYPRIRRVDGAHARVWPRHLTADERGGSAEHCRRSAAGKIARIKTVRRGSAARQFCAHPRR